MKKKLFLSRALKVLLYIEVGYVLLASIFLNLGVIPKLINTGPDELKIDYSWAISFFPSTVYVRNANFRVQDRNVQLFGKLSGTFLFISLPKLLKRQFVVHYLEGQNLKFFFRLRRKPEEIVKLSKDAVPPIPGLTDMTKPTTPKKPSDPSEENRQWRLRMDHVHIASISEIWFDRFHFEGNASVRGGFYLKPSHAVEVYPAVLSFSDGKLAGSGEPFLEHISGAIHTHLPLLNTTDGEEEPIPPHVNATIELHAPIKGIESANAYLKSIKWLVLSGGEGQLNVKVGVEKGVLMPGSHVEAVSKAITAQIWQQKVVGDGLVSWTLVDGEPRKGIAEVKLDRFALGRMQDKGPALIKGQGLIITLESENPDLDDPVKHPRARVQIPNARIEDLSYLNGFLPSGPGIKVLGGQGILDADFAIGGNEKDSGHIKIEAPVWKAEIAEHTLEGKLGVGVHISGGSIERGKIKVSELLLDLQSIKAEDGPSDWWAKVRIFGADFGWKNSTELSGKVDVKAKDATLLTKLYLTGKGKPLPGFVAGLLDFPDLKLSAQVKLDKEGFLVRYLEADAKNSRLRGWLGKRGKERHAMALLEVGLLAAALEVSDDDTRVIINDAIKWYQNHSAKGLSQFTSSLSK